MVVKGDASAELITPNSAVVQTTVDNSLVSAVPIEVSGAMRNADSFLKLEPGFSAQLGDGNLNVVFASINGGATGGTTRLRSTAQRFPQLRSGPVWEAPL